MCEPALNQINVPAVLWWSSSGGDFCRSFVTIVWTRKHLTPGVNRMNVVGMTVAFEQRLAPVTHSGLTRSA